MWVGYDEGDEGDEVTQVIAELAKVALAAAGVTAVGLVGTGVWLSLYYRPTPAAGNPYSSSTASDTVQLVDWVRFAHLWTARLFMVSLLVVLALAVIRVLREARPAMGAVLAGAACVLAGAGLFTGRMLPFDQLALWAVTPGDSLSGYRPFFGDQIRFVIVGGVEADAPNVAVALVIHALLLPALLLGVALGARLVARSSRPSRRA